jgi:hypothetical protein
VVHGDGDLMALYIFSSCVSFASSLLHRAASRSHSPSFLCLCIVFCVFGTQGSVDNVTRLFDIPDRQGKLSNRIGGFNAKGEKLELCADSASDKERWVDAIASPRSRVGLHG